MIQPFVGLIGFGVSIVALNYYASRYNYERSIEAFFLLAMTAIPMMLVEVISIVLTPSNFSLWLKNLSILNYLIRILGFIITILLMTLFYWSLNDYHYSFMSGVFGIDNRSLPPNEIRSPDNVPHYHNYFRLVGIIKNNTILFWSTIITLLLFLFVFSRDKNTEDGYWVTGNTFLSYLNPIGLFKSISFSESNNTAAATTSTCSTNDRTCSNQFKGQQEQDQQQQAIRFKMHILEFIVRCFFGPLMFCSICDNLPGLYYKGGNDVKSFFNHHFMDFFYYAQNLIFTADLCFATIGYLSPAAFLSVESTVYGWIIALLCYNPFFSLINDRYIIYAMNKPWNEWFDAMNNNQNASQWKSFRIWGCIILFLQFLFAYCSMCYGIRYSNLSYRTLITTGPYYFFQHPAYIVKLLSFAMIHVPWVDIAALQQQKQLLMNNNNNNSNNKDNSSISISKLPLPTYFNAQSIRYCISFALIVIVYILRARTEEAHLRAATAMSGERRLSSSLYEEYARAVSSRWQWRHWWMMMTAVQQKPHHQ